MSASGPSGPLVFIVTCNDGNNSVKYNVYKHRLR